MDIVDLYIGQFDVSNIIVRLDGNKYIVFKKTLSVS